WWESFSDPALDALIAKAHAHNRDMREALANLGEARALRAQAGTAYYPSVPITAEAHRQGLNRTTSGDSNNVVRERNQFLGALDASWEIDLFGGTARLVEAADAGIRQREAEWRDVWLAV